MTTCKRCGVELKGNDKRETDDHCGFCSVKLGLKSEIKYDGNMNIVTDPRNAASFIWVGLVIIIGGIVIFSSSGQLDSYFEGRTTDEKIADTVKNIELTDEYCNKLEDLRYSIRGNAYSQDSIKMIDAKLLQCKFNEIFPSVELTKVNNRR